MKKRSVILAALSLFSFMFSATAFSEEALFVQPYRVKIYAKPSIASEVLCAVDSGFQFVPISREGSWVKLAFKGKQGFIPAVQVAKTPPLGKSAAQGADAAPKLGVRVRASSSSAVVAGMKGLTYEDRARVTKGEQSDFEALDKVNALKIPPDELNLFRLEGGKR